MLEVFVKITEPYAAQMFLFGAYLLVIGLGGIVRAWWE